MGQVRRTTRTLGTELWRAIVEQLDQGILVFNDMGVSIFGNEEAARLIGYSTRDLLDLDISDLVSLCQPRRLDSVGFARALRRGDLEGDGMQSFEIATADRHLTVRPFKLVLENGHVIVIALRESLRWQEALIAQSALSDFQGPLSVSLSYADTLLQRIGEGDALPFELNDLARIIRESLERLQQTWEGLSDLNEASAEFGSPRFEAVDLDEVLIEAELTMIRRSVIDLPPIEKRLPFELRSLRVERAGFQRAMLAILSGCAARLHSGSYLLVTASNEGSGHVDIAVTIQRGGNLQNYHLDAMPLALAETILLRYGGRMRIDANPMGLHVLIPAWLS